MVIQSAPATERALACRIGPKSD